MSEIALYKALIEAGASEESAQAAVDDLARSQGVATKGDLAELKTCVANLRAETIKWVVGIGLGVVVVIVSVLLRLLQPS